MRPVLLSVIFLIACLATAVIASSSSWGVRSARDVLLTKERILRFPRRNNYQNVDYRFPKSGQINNRVITAVYVRDNFRNSSGATAKLYAGGKGFRFVSITLNSQYNRGINSTVEVYGKK